MSKKSSKKTIKKEPYAVIAARLLMAAVFLYSGVYHTVVVLMVIYSGSLDAPRWVGTALAVGDALVLGGIITAFFRRYLISFGLTPAGSVVYLKAAGYIVGMIRKELDTHSVKAELVLMDREYMYHLYPLGITAVISFGLALWAVIGKIRRRRYEKHLAETAPVKSIIEP